MSTGDTAPRSCGPRTRNGERVSQYGGIEVLLSRQFLVGVVEGPLEAVTSALGVEPERSWGGAERDGCSYAYVETAEDVFTLVSWDEAESVEIYAHIGETSARQLPTQPALERFLALAELEREKVVFGFRPTGAPDPDLESVDPVPGPPSLAEVLELPRSVTGLGLDRPVADIRTTVRTMTYNQLQHVLGKFCSGWPGDGEHRCECTAMDKRVGPDDEDVSPLEMHLEAESLARDRVDAWWWYEHCGPELPVNGIPVSEYLQQFAAYDRG